MSSNDGPARDAEESDPGVQDGTERPATDIDAGTDMGAEKGADEDAADMHDDTYGDGAEPGPSVWGAVPDAEPSGTGSQRAYPPALLIGLIAAVGVGAFFAGTFVTGMDAVSEQYIDDAIAKLELKLLQDRLPRAAPQEQPMPQIRPAGGSDPIIGNADAPIEIIEYSDFQCPFCARFYEQTLPQLIDEYIAPGKAKLAFRDFPIQNIHPNAAAAALAAECANEQDKFKGMHDVLFERQREWGAQSTVAALGLFSQYAEEIEADQAAFDACVASQRHLQIISDDLNEGSSYGVTGTPGFFVGNAQIGYVEIKGAQPYEVFKQIIDSQLGA